ncbi:beta-ketoacyl synthase chain length factor [Ramlibacter ginsenosidimutans]|uniref:Beta-ketoacyl synthase chain length factor n=1 Tax=Ramlibacter ginsenosidimutans TaxID=502333 RepID=A0A934TUL4_9BURK|nr:beta-ketoacyl synthase chain length factor [Ramlibacter ginsenosidimutans]MBK6007560.1 beta-ketoacyl synthase chain length factor [Ramlibacter ginsenosidimutans]
MQATLLGVGLIGPGLPSWSEAIAVLRGEAPWVSAASVVPPPQRLPAAERRRAGAAVKIALSVADAACSDAARDPGTMATVFTSSSGDGANCSALCETLAHPPGPDRLVSPTRFTNSVHNAAAGYWHIAVGSRHTSSSICAHDDSFGAGLMAALAQVPALPAPVLLVASDTPYPEPLNATRPLPDTMGVALVLGASGTPGAAAQLRTRLLPMAQAGAATRCGDAGLERLRERIPAARALPLLEAIARRQPARVVLPVSAQLALEIELDFAP